MKVLVVISLLFMVNVSPSVCSIVDKFKEFEVVPDVLTVAPSKLLEVGVIFKFSNSVPFVPRITTLSILLTYHI